MSCPAEIKHQLSHVAAETQQLISEEAAAPQQLHHQGTVLSRGLSEPIAMALQRPHILLRVMETF